MTIQETAFSIRNNATKLLKAKKIESMIEVSGDLYYTGSYALDLMTWNDIDMQIVLKDGFNATEVLCNLCNHIAKDEGFIEAQIINFQGDYKPKMPRGIYLGLKLNCKDLGGMWKLDIWCLSKPDFDKNRALMESLKSKLNLNNRDLILEVKHELMSETGRVPQMGSHFLYQAVLLEEKTDKESIYNFLEERKILVNKSSTNAS